MRHQIDILNNGLNNSPILSHNRDILTNRLRDATFLTDCTQRRPVRRRDGALVALSGARWREPAGTAGPR